MLFLRVELLALPGIQLQLPYHPHLRWQFPSQWVSKLVNTSLLQPSARVRGSNYSDILKHMQFYLLFDISFKKESRPNTHNVGKQKKKLVLSVKRLYSGSSQGKIRITYSFSESTLLQVIPQVSKLLPNKCEVAQWAVYTSKICNTHWWFCHWTGCHLYTYWVMNRCTDESNFNHRRWLLIAAAFSQ